MHHGILEIHAQLVDRFLHHQQADELLLPVDPEVRPERAAPSKRAARHAAAGGDVTLREMARDYPTTEREFTNLSGVGAKKLDEFGAQFMDAITKYLRENPRQSFD